MTKEKIFKFCINSGLAIYGIYLADHIEKSIVIVIFIVYFFLMQAYTGSLIGRGPISYRVEIGVFPNWGNIFRNLDPENGEKIVAFLREHTNNKVYMQEKVFNMFCTYNQIPQIWERNRYVSNLSFRGIVEHWIQYPDGEDGATSLLHTNTEFGQTVKKLFKNCYGYDETSRGLFSLPNFMISPNSIGIIAPHLEQWGTIINEGKIAEIDYGIFPGATPSKDTVFGYMLSLPSNDLKNHIKWPKKLQKFLNEAQVEYECHNPDWIGQDSMHYFRHKFYDLNVTLWPMEAF